MNEIIYISSYSIEAETQRMQHNFIPVIKEAVGDVPVEISAMFNRPLGNVDWVIECRKGKAGTKWIVDNINAGGHK